MKREKREESERKFLSRFHFDRKGRGLVGVEIEYFLACPGEDFRPAPDSVRFLQGVGPAWGPELSACQVEYHTRPTYRWGVLTTDLRRGLREGRSRAGEIERRLVACEVGPRDMSLDVYSENARYVRIAEKLPLETLRAACRVAGTHVHVGVCNIEEAIETHNLLAEHLPQFLAMGDHSKGERVSLYRVMAPVWEPPHYESVAHFCRVARDQGFQNDPRSCYHLVRINPVGTVEVRAFGVTESVDEVVAWAKEVKRLSK